MTYKLNIKQLIVKWGPIIDVLKRQSNWNPCITEEKFATLAEEVHCFFNVPMITEGPYPKLSFKQELKSSGFLPVMLRIYAIYGISDYKKVYKYYVKMVDNLSDDSEKQMYQAEHEEYLFIKNINIKMRKDKLKKLNEL